MRVRMNLVAAALSVVVILALAARAGAQVTVGSKPVLDFVAVDGTRVNPSALAGKIVVVDFWATWCGPCMAEADHMVQVYNQYKDKGLVMIGIDMDRSKDQMIAVAKEKGFVWPQYFDGKVWQTQLATEWGVRGIPATFILSPDGVVLWHGHPAGIDQQLAEAFAKHPPRLLSPEQTAKVTALLDKAEAALKEAKTADAMAAAAKIPVEAKSETSLKARIEVVMTQLTGLADASLKEAEAALEAKEFATAIPKLRDVSKLSGVSAATKAAELLKTTLANPEAKAALEASAKAEKEKERADKAAELLAAAQKTQEAKKHEQAYGQFKLIAQQYPGTDAATAAAEQVKTYEADKSFMTRANEANTAGKAKGMMSMAASYKAAGRNDLAKQKYEQVIKDFPGTSYAEQAKKEMAGLK
jgi:thiol-disulfide isomerase/thioredoxin